MHARLRGQKKLINSLPDYKSDFPFLADEIAEPRPDMNIKVAAFTLSVKSINMWSTQSSHLIILSHIARKQMCYHMIIWTEQGRCQAPR